MDDARRFERMEELFAQARELPSHERSAFVRQACGDDDDLRTEIEGLLAVDSTASGGLMDRALDSDGFELEESRSRPQTIGPYRVLGLCGSGGMGTVYEAEQDSPRRRVALKVIQSGLLRPDLLRRFRREADILARLQHPGIAQIFEMGEFEVDGCVQPFIAMEFVDGSPLLAYATAHALQVAARVQIFIRVCEAVQYAHEAGIVHRDLKPDNIFVVVDSGTDAETPAGRPKILDFGVARLVDTDAKLTIATGAGQLLGSVPYMSPEQATGEVQEIGPRSDVYALGVLLFELLTGRLPYAVRDRPLADALHAIRHDEPSRLGSADPGLRGDLETIVGKCIEKEPDRRYESVAALATDLRRYLEERPITARPPSTWYQLQKFTRRHRALVGGVAATVLAIVIGAIVAVVLAVRANESAVLARTSQQLSERAAYRASLAAASALLETDPAHARRVLQETPEALRGWEWRYLSSALSRFLREFGNVRTPYEPPYSTWPVHGMCLVADGARVIAPIDDTRFRVWETRTGAVVRTFEVPAKIRSWSAARRGALLAVALEDGRVVVADPRADTPSWTEWFEGDDIWAIEVDRQGTRIAIHRKKELRVGRREDWRVIPVDERAHWNQPFLDFSPDGKRIVGMNEQGVVIWDVATGQPVCDPMKSEQGHWSLAFTADGERVVSGQMRREIRIFDPETGKYDVELLGHTSSVRAVATHGDGCMLSVDHNVIRVWDIEREEQVAIFDAPGTIQAEFVDENHVLSLTGGKFRLWTLGDARARMLVGHRGHIFDASFSGDGDLLMTNAPWGAALVWDVLESEPLARLPLKTGAPLAFDRSGENLLSSVERWAPGWLERHEWPTARSVKLRRDENRMFQGVTDDKFRVDTSPAALPMQRLTVFRTDHGAKRDAAAPWVFVDGASLEVEAPKIAPTVGEHPILVLGNLLSGAWHGYGGTISEFLVFDGHLSSKAGASIDAYLGARRSGGKAELALDRDSSSRLLVHFRAEAKSVERDQKGRVYAWRAANDPRLRLVARGTNADCLSFVPGESGKPAGVSFVQAYHVSRRLEMAFPQVRGKERLTVCWLGSYASRMTQAAYGIGTLKVAFADSPRDERITKPWRRFCASADGKHVAEKAYVSGAGPVTVRQAKTGYGVATFDGQYESFGFHPDSKRIACGSIDGHIDVFDVETKALVERFKAHSGGCYDVAFSPDGTRLATSGNDNTVRIWDSEAFEFLLELPGHRSYVRAVAWSPDGTMLCSASGDYVARIWDSVSREERDRQRLANRALMDEVRGRVEQIFREESTAEERMVAVRRAWPEDEKRRRAAFKVLARLR